MESALPTHFQQFVGTNDTVVDLACGYGEFINNIHAGQKIAINLNPDSREYLAEGVRSRADRST